MRPTTNLDQIDYHATAESIQSPLPSISYCAFANTRGLPPYPMHTADVTEAQPPSAPSQKAKDFAQIADNQTEFSNHDFVG